MKVNFKTVLVVSALSTGASVAFAEQADRSDFWRNLKPNTYYSLTPELASELNLNYDQLLNELRGAKNERLVFKINEANEITDVSVFDSHVNTTSPDFITEHSDNMSLVKP